MEKESLLLREHLHSKNEEGWYRLTKKGEELSAVIQALNTWGKSWLQSATEVLIVPKTIAEARNSSQRY